MAEKYEQPTEHFVHTHTSHFHNKFFFYAYGANIYTVYHIISIRTKPSFFRNSRSMPNVFVLSFLMAPTQKVTISTRSLLLTPSPPKQAERNV